MKTICDIGFRCCNKNVQEPSSHNLQLHHGQMRRQSTLSWRITGGGRRRSRISRENRIRDDVIRVCEASIAAVVVGAPRRCERRIVRYIMWRWWVMRGRRGLLGSLWLLLTLLLRCLCSKNLLTRCLHHELFSWQVAISLCVFGGKQEWRSTAKQHITFKNVSKSMDLLSKARVR